MTKQETFDIVAAHLLKQGKRSEAFISGDDRACAYRGEDGLKCAAGILIPDEKYSPNMENVSAREGEMRRLFEELGHDSGLVIQLQRIHDSKFPEEWARHLQECANRNELEWKFGGESTVPA